MGSSLSISGSVLAANGIGVNANPDWVQLFLVLQFAEVAVHDSVLSNGFDIQNGLSDVPGGAPVDVTGSTFGTASFHSHTCVGMPPTRCRRTPEPRSGTCQVP